MEDIGVIETELLLSDVQIVERRLEKIAKDVKKLDKEAIEEKTVLEDALSILRTGKQLRKATFTAKSVQYFNALGLLTIKPLFYVANVGANYKEESKFVDMVKQHAHNESSEVVVVCAHTESELAKLSDTEVSEMREELLLGENGIDKVISTAYKTLELISYFTTGEKETRAWAIKRNTVAPVAASAIHTDFEKNFIRAEVVSYDDFIRTGSSHRAKEAGLFRLEGKEYVVQDGDVIVFRVGQ